MPSRAPDCAATGVSFVVASLLLMTLVLPAEYGIDPLGTGRALGLLDLFSAQDAAPTPEPEDRANLRRASTRPSRRHSPFVPRRRSSTSTASRRIAGWCMPGRPPAKVKYEFHGEPEDHRLKVQSYEKQEGDFSSGTLTAPFTGIHGWYWENAGERDLTITLTTAGFYTAANELRPKFDPVKHKEVVERVPHELQTPARIHRTIPSTPLSASSL
jgi:hypothetical protein